MFIPLMPVNCRGVQILVHGEDKGKFDPASGVAELCKVGTQMKQGEPLVVIHYNDEKRLKAAMITLRQLSSRTQAS